MSDDKFFENNEEAEEVQTIKLGEDEYSETELNRLVGLGKMAAEAEEKYKTKIDRVWPEYTKATQRESDYKRQIEELQAKVNQPAQPIQTSAELSAEQKELARKQLDELGYGQDQFRAIVREELAAKELLSDIDGLLDTAKDNGQPSATPQELLQHMAETGIKNPAKAYKDMFESELDAIKEKKLAEIKPSGMVTTTSSQAGAKQPVPAKLPRNREELAKQVLESLGGSQ